MIALEWTTVHNAISGIDLLNCNLSQDKLVCTSDKKIGIFKHVLSNVNYWNHNNTRVDDHLRIVNNNESVVFGGDWENSINSGIGVVNLENCSAIAYTTMKDDALPLTIFNLKSVCAFHYDPNATIYIGNMTYTRFVLYNGTEGKVTFKSNSTVAQFSSTERGYAFLTIEDTTFENSIVIFMGVTMALGFILYIVFAFLSSFYMV